MRSGWLGGRLRGPSNIGEVDRLPSERKTVELPAEPGPALGESAPLPAGYFLVDVVERMADAQESYDDELARLTADVEVMGVASAWVGELQVHAEGRFEALQRAILEAPRGEFRRTGWTRQLVAVALVLGVVQRARRGWS